MSLHPDWSKEESHTSLKTVLKWEIQHLLQRLAEAGEETFLFTVSIKDGGTTEMGSPKGQVFLSTTDLQNIKSQFLSYCKGFSENVEDNMEIYRDLSSGQLLMGPRTFVDSDNRRKRRKKTYLQQSKIALRDGDKESMIQEVSSDDNSRGNSLNQGQEEILLGSTADEGLLDSTADLDLYSGRSRRKRTPKKVLTNYSAARENLNPELCDEMIEKLDNQSENFEMTGALYKDFYVKKSQSMDQICDNQSESLELTSHSEDFSMNVLQDNQDMDIYCSQKPAQVAEGGELDVLFQKTKDSASRKIKNATRKSTKSNNKSFQETDLKCSFLTEKSLPVFPESSGPRSSFYANSVGVANSMGGEEVCFPLTTFGEDGHMRILMSNSDIVEDNPVLPRENNLLPGRQTRENSLLPGQLAKSTDNSPKHEKQASENNAFYTPPRKKGFKPVPHDENPAETALLDASKLGVGRYKCLMCSQTTRDRHDLKRHLRTHTKEKPYQCSLCGKRFTRKWDLENHYTRHSKLDHDEAYTKSSKVSNKTNESSNAEVLTYEKLVAKLLMERKISVSTNGETENIEGGSDVTDGQDTSGNIDHLKEGITESAEDVVSETSGRGIKKERMDWNEASGVFDQSDDDKTKVDKECKSSSVTDISQEALLDNLAVKFMNDTLSSVDMEEESDIKVEPVDDVKR